MLLAFDPHGNGLMAVERYRPLAERFGMILAGSNDSRNGLGMEETGLILQELFREIRTRFPADTSQIYLAGFSGGSRVAALAAMFFKKVRGVAACGAGLPVIHRDPLYRTDYFGITGKADFNLAEMMMIREELKAGGFRYFIGTFDGGHEWPPPESLETAVMWFEFNRCLEKEISPPDTLESALNRRLGDMGQYIRHLDGHPEIIRREIREQQMLGEALSTKGTGWWEKKVRFLKTQAEAGENDASLQARRLLSYLSLICYSAVSHALSRNDRGEVRRLTAIYEIADPENPVILQLKQKIQGWN